jgi:hypothetical protein
MFVLCPDLSVKSKREIIRAALAPIGKVTSVFMITTNESKGIGNCIVKFNNFEEAIKCVDLLDKTVSNVCCFRPEFVVIICAVVDIVRCCWVVAEESLFVRYQRINCMI